MDATGLDPAIAAYYREGREAERLVTSSRLEGLRSLELLGRFLPPAPAAVLDVGGGPGRYALHLQQQGYDVTLIDPVELHVAQARDQGVRKAYVGDARYLATRDVAADAVLMLGPLYHLIDRPARLAALRGALRILRPGGLVMAAGISRFASTLDGIRRGFLAEPEFEAIVRGDLETGVHLNPSGRTGWFTTAYFHRPDELGNELAQVGFRDVAVMAIEGPAASVDEEWLDDEDRRQTLLRAIRRVEAEPSLLGMSLHLMAVGYSPVVAPT